MQLPREPNLILSSVNLTRRVGAIFNPNSRTLTAESGSWLTDTFDSVPPASEMVVMLLTCRMIGKWFSLSDPDLKGRDVHESAGHCRSTATASTGFAIPAWARSITCYQMHRDADVIASVTVGLPSGPNKD